MAPVISIEEHLARILETTGRLPAESVPLEQAAGRCLREPVTALLDVPPWTNSAMDGYAVRFADIREADENSPVTLRVVAEVPAGASTDPPIGPGESARIMTGAPLPSAADTVVPQELTDGGLEAVRVEAALEPGRHVRVAGEDCRTGDRILEPGLKISPESIASIASVGVAEAVVSRRPRVAVIATGDELVAPGDSIGRGQIPDSNSLLVAELARAQGAEVITSGRVGDRPGELERAVEAARDADLIVMTGGVSVGAHDPVKELFADGDEVRFVRVLMQPGKPQAFGRLREGPLVFGLPGNPVSVWVSFSVFVKPCLRLMQGFRQVTQKPITAAAERGWKTPVGRTQILPARIIDHGGFRTVEPAGPGGSGSHLVASLAAANGYAIVEAEIEQVSQGDEVPTVRFADLDQHIVNPNLRRA